MSDKTMNNTDKVASTKTKKKGSRSKLARRVRRTAAAVCLASAIVVGVIPVPESSPIAALNAEAAGNQTTVGIPPKQADLAIDPSELGAGQNNVESAYTWEKITGASGTTKGTSKVPVLDKNTYDNLIYSSFLAGSNIEIGWALYNDTGGSRAVILHCGEGTMAGMLEIPDTVDAYRPLSANMGTSGGQFVATSRNNKALFYLAEEETTRSVPRIDPSTKQPVLDHDNNPLYDNVYVPPVFKACTYNDNVWKDMIKEDPTKINSLYFLVDSSSTVMPSNGSSMDLTSAGASGWSGNPDQYVYANKEYERYQRTVNEAEQWICNIPVVYIGNQNLVLDNTSQSGTLTNRWAIDSDSINTTPKNGVFAGQSRVSGLKVSKYLVGIGNYAFYMCTGIQRVQLSNGIAEIGHDAFAGCRSLVAVDFEAVPSFEPGGASRPLNSLEAIYERCFKDCIFLESIDIPLNVNTICDAAFSGCEKLGSVIYAENTALEKIGYNVFKDCSSLTSLTIPKTVGLFNLNNIYGCTKLTDLVIAGNTRLTHGLLGTDADAGYKNRSQQTAEVDGTSNPACTQQLYSEMTTFCCPYIYGAAVNGTWTDGIGINGFLDTQVSPGKFYIQGKSGTPAYQFAAYHGIPFQYDHDDLTAPDEAELIDYTDDDHNATYEVKLMWRADKFGNLKKMAFDGDPKDIEIPGNVGRYEIKTLDTGSFKNKCTLKRVTIPSTVTQINTGAFQGCHNLEDVIFRDASTMVTMQDGAFNTQKWETEGTETHMPKCKHTFTNPNTFDCPDDTPYLSFTGTVYDETTGKVTVPFRYAMNAANRLNNGSQNKAFITYYTGWPMNLTIRLEPSAQGEQTSSGEPKYVSTLVDYHHYADFNATDPRFAKKKEYDSNPYVIVGAASKTKNVPYPYMNDLILSLFKGSTATSDDLTEAREATFHIKVPKGVEAIKTGLFSNAYGQFKEPPLLFASLAGSSAVSTGITDKGRMIPAYDVDGYYPAYVVDVNRAMVKSGVTSMSGTSPSAITTKYETDGKTVSKDSNGQEIRTNVTKIMDCITTGADTDVVSLEFGSIHEFEPFTVTGMTKLKNIIINGGSTGINDATEEGELIIDPYAFASEYTSADYTAPRMTQVSQRKPKTGSGTTLPALGNIVIEGGSGPIGDYAFNNLDGLYNMDLGMNVTNELTKKTRQWSAESALGLRPWRGCTHLAGKPDQGTLTFSSPCTLIYDDGAVYSSDKSILYCCLESANSGLTVNNKDTKQLRPEAFEDCVSVQYVNLRGTSIDVVPERAFANTRSLLSIELPSTCVGIRRDAFYDSVVNTVEMGTNMSQIVDGAFNTEKNLNSDGTYVNKITVRGIADDVDLQNRLFGVMFSRTETPDPKADDPNHVKVNYGNFHISDEEVSAEFVITVLTDGHGVKDGVVGQYQIDPDNALAKRALKGTPLQMYLPQNTDEIEFEDGYYFNYWGDKNFNKYGDGIKCSDVKVNGDMTVIAYSTTKTVEVRFYSSNAEDAELIETKNVQVGHTFEDVPSLPKIDGKRTNPEDWKSTEMPPLKIDEEFKDKEAGYNYYYSPVGSTPEGGGDIPAPGPGGGSGDKPQESNELVQLNTDGQTITIRLTFRNKATDEWRTDEVTCADGAKVADAIGNLANPGDTAGYTFDGWNHGGLPTEFKAGVSYKEYTAQYTQKATGGSGNPPTVDADGNITIKFTYRDTTTGKVKSLPLKFANGTSLADVKDLPEPDDVGIYEFTGWSPELPTIFDASKCSSEYVAQYTEKKQTPASGNGVTPPEVDSDGNFIIHFYGEDGSVEVPGSPIKVAPGTAWKDILWMPVAPAVEGKTFSAWSPTPPDKCEEGKVSGRYIATYTGPGADIDAPAIAQYHYVEVRNGQIWTPTSGLATSGKFVEGTKVFIRANDPARTQEFDSWSADSSNVVEFGNAAASETSIRVPEEDVLLIANYKAKESTTPSGSGSGSGSASGSNTTSSTENKNNTTVDITKNGISNKNLAAANVGGSTDNFMLRVTDSQAATEAILRALMAEYGDLDGIKYFPMDISLYDAKGEKKVTDTTGLQVTVTIPLPDSLAPYAGNCKVAGVVNDTLDKITPKFTTIDGIPCISFVATHFSPYVIYVKADEIVSYGDGTGGGTGSGSGTIGGPKDDSPNTGDIHPKWFVVMGLTAIAIILFLIKGSDGSKKKAKVKTKK